MNANHVTYFIVALCSLGLSCGNVSAEEEVRIWTRTADGETCRATLCGKDMDPKSGEEVIKLLLQNGKKTGWMQLSIFSKEDWEYVRQANLAGRVAIETDTVKARGEDNRTAEVDARTAELARLAAGGGEVLIKEVYTPDDGSVLRRMLGREVVLEGILLEVCDSRSGKTRYLEFSASRGVDDICGRYPVQGEAVPSLGQLKPLEGRRLKITGKVQIEIGTGRVMLHLERRDQLQDLGPGAAGVEDGEASSGQSGKQKAK